MHNSIYHYINIPVGFVNIPNVFFCFVRCFTYMYYAYFVFFASIYSISCFPCNARFQRLLPWWWCMCCYCLFISSASYKFASKVITFFVSMYFFFWTICHCLFHLFLIFISTHSIFGLFLNLSVSIWNSHNVFIVYFHALWSDYVPYHAYSIIYLYLLKDKDIQSDQMTN